MAIDVDPRRNGVVIRALPLSGVAAFLTTLMLILDHVIPWSAYVQASLDWWIDDAVAIACLTPFCLVMVAPVVGRFAGLAQTAADLESASAGRNVHEAQGSYRAVESVCFIAALVGSLWLALGPVTRICFTFFFCPLFGWRYAAVYAKPPPES